MPDLKTEFFEIGEKEFQFLVDEFGFKKKARKTDVRVYSLRYETETTKVELGFEWRDQYIYLLLGRLTVKKPQRGCLVLRMSFCI